MLLCQKKKYPAPSGILRNYKLNKERKIIMNPVKIGLVGLRFGAGLASGRLLGTENEKYVRLTAVCDMNKELVEPFAEKHQLPAYTDVIQRVVIVLNSGTAAVLLHGGLGALGDDVAEILDLYVGIVHVRGNVGGICDGTAADDGNLDLVHVMSPVDFGFSPMGKYPYYIVIFPKSQ